MSKEVFEARTLSSFDLSIGTGIALESVFTPTSTRYDDERKIPNNKKVNYDIHVFNIYTMCRNIVSATLTKDKDILYANKELLVVVSNEIQTLIDLYYQNDVKILFILPDEKKDFVRYNKDKTDIMRKAYLQYANMVPVVSELKSTLPLLVDKLPQDKNTLLLTHYSNDLLNYGNKVSLLESHTGVIKTQGQFNTKFSKAGKLDLSNIPFLDVTLYILGDKALIKPAGRAIKWKLHEISQKHKWTPRTTRAKVMSDISKYPDIKMFIKGLKRK